MKAYNVDNDDWNTMDPYPVAMDFATAITGANRMLVFAGQTVAAVVREYDPIDDDWIDRGTLNAGGIYGTANIVYND